MAKLPRKLLLRMKPKWGWLQFSLRSMLVMTTFCGLWLGWRVNEVRHQREVLAFIQSFGAKAYFDYHFDIKHGGFVIDPGREPPSNSWLRRTIGQEYFQRIAGLDFRGTSLTDQDLERLAGLAELSELEVLDLADTQVTDTGLKHLKRFPQFRLLDLYNTQVTSAGLVHLEGLRRLGWLNLINTKITSEGLAHLRGLTGLQLARLNNTQVTDAGLEYFQGLTGLRGLDLRNTQVTDAGLAKLRKSLPNCQIDGP